MRKIDPVLEKLNSCNDRCDSTVLEREKGIIPRWIGGDTDSPDLMVIGLNPGKCDTTERFLYKEFVRDAPKLVVKFTNHCMMDPGNQKNNFIVKLVELFKDIFGNDNFLRQIYITNLVKCESEVNGVIDPKTKKHCFEKFLKEEIDLLKPRVILALGKEVTQYLKESGYKNIVSCPHPSPSNVSGKKFWINSSKERRALIRTIKDKLSSVQ